MWSMQYKRRGNGLAFLCMCRVFMGRRDKLTGQFDPRNGDWSNFLNPCNREKRRLVSECVQIKLRLRRLMLEM